MIVMRDSTNGTTIPTDTPVVAGYIDGLYRWPQTWWDRFPNSVKLTIAVSASNQADILDVETGDAAPNDIPGWCDRFNRPNRRRPTVYCNRATWPAARAAVGNRSVDYWISTLDGTTFVPGAVAAQYNDFGGYDESFVSDPTWLLGAINPMDLNTARAFIWLYRMMFFGPSSLSEPNAQAAIDSYASRMAKGENAEAVLTDMFNDAQKDGRLNPFFKVS